MCYHFQASMENVRGREAYFGLYKMPDPLHKADTKVVRRFRSHNSL